MRVIWTIVMMLWGALAWAEGAQVAPFVGTYTGSAVIEDGMTRNMNVKIAQTKQGFNVTWTSTNIWDDGRSKDKTYSVDFVPTPREGVYAAGQKRNLFGHNVQLDPMKGEPYVWARIHGETLTVYSLFVGPDGHYEMQQYDRTLTETGLDLQFERIHNGDSKKQITAPLVRQ